MEDIRFLNGLKNLNDIDGKGGEDVIKSLLTQSDTSPQLNVGVTPEKIIETFIQCIPYTGFPRILNAIFIAKKIFNDNNMATL